MPLLTRRARKFNEALPASRGPPPRVRRKSPLVSRLPQRNPRAHANGDYIRGQGRWRRSLGKILWLQPTLLLNRCPVQRRVLCSRASSLPSTCPSSPSNHVWEWKCSRTDTQDDVDEGSVAGDSIRRSRKKNEAERKQFLEDDPHSGEVEPHRMYCKTCSTWVDLNPKLRYIMKLWVEHRRHCKGVDRAER